MSSCSLNAHVINPEGKVVESKLFNDLRLYTSDRDTAVEHYGIATSQEFIEKFKDQVEFDENKEVTFKSYKKISKVREKSNLLDTLNKVVEEGDYEYKDAIDKVQDFNRNNPYNENFMATLTPLYGVYHLSVVPRTSVNETLLKDIVRKQTLQERLIYQLRDHGVSVSFLTNGNNRYSTENAEKTAEGLYNLISIVQGEDTTAALAEEAGHFAIGALGNNPLVTRLINILDEETQKKVLGKEYSTKDLGYNPRREVAGYLVGKALAKDLANRTPWQKLTHRIVQRVKQIFAKFTRNDVLYDSVIAEKTAEEIATGFMSENFEGKIERALETQETLYKRRKEGKEGNKEDDTIVRRYKDSKTESQYSPIATYKAMVTQLKKLSMELDNISSDRLNSMIKEILLRNDYSMQESSEVENVALDSMAYKGIAGILSGMNALNRIEEVQQILKNVDIDESAQITAQDKVNIKNNLVQYAKDLRRVRTFRTNLMILAKLVNDLLVNNHKSEASYLTEDNKLIETNLRDIYDEIREVDKQLAPILKNKERKLFLYALTDIYGDKYVNLSSQVLFTKVEGRKTKAFVKEVYEGPQNAEAFISNCLNSLEYDNNIFDQWLASMSNNPDVIGQLYDKATKAANKQADDSVNHIWDSLRILEERFHKLGYKDQRIFYETFDNGTLTGNIISELNWGKWERDRKEFFDKERAAFKEHYKDLDELSESQAALRWDRWFRPKFKQWNREHSKFRVLNQGKENEEKYFIPNDNYSNPAFDKLFGTEEHRNSLYSIYQDYMLLKDEIDHQLEQGSTLNCRAPQFKGTATDRYKNMRILESKSKALGHTIRSLLTDTFCSSSEDTDYGNLQTYNSEEDSLYYNEIEFEKEKLNRIPTYGINKLQDMAELSTDIFQSTLAYASMAYNYSAMKSIVDTLEVGMTVLKDRPVHGNSGETSRAYVRLMKHLEKQVYGISVPQKAVGKIVLNKVLDVINRVAAGMWLAGNMIGGTVNLGTGIIEMSKEAGAGEYYSVKDFNKAVGQYFNDFIKHFGTHLKDFGVADPDSKLALFARHFNVRSENTENYRDWFTRKSRMQNFMKKFLWIPYKSGDHFMQFIPYMAIANSTKLYYVDNSDTSLNGRTKIVEIPLYEAYEVTENKDEHGNKNGYKFGLKNDKDGKPIRYYKSPTARNNYHMLMDLASRLDSKTINESWKDYAAKRIPANQLQYLKDHNYDIETKGLSSIIREEAEKYIWGFNDEVDYMNKAREVTNRLHGNYDKADDVLMSQNLIGKALLTMKKWAVGMLQRRIAKNHYNIAVGHQVEGSLNTVAKVFIRQFHSKEDFLNGVRMLLLPFGKDAAETCKAMGWSANQIANLKRNFYDGVAILILAILRGISKLPPDDDEYWEKTYGSNWRKYKKMYGAEDPENDVALGLLYYFSNRLYREQSALNMPYPGWYWEANTLLDLVPSGFSAMMDLGKLMYEIGGDIVVGDDSDSRFYYQSTKEGKYEKGDPKWQAHLSRLIPYWKNIYALEHPYDAAASYEYGRRVKTR